MKVFSLYHSLYVIRNEIGSSAHTNMYDVHQSYLYNSGKFTFPLGVNQFADLEEPGRGLRPPKGTGGKRGGKRGGSDYMANGNRNRNMAMNG